MKLTFYGAARTVTGSCHCLEACGRRILIDCGLQQGSGEIDNAELPFHPGELDLVILTLIHQSMLIGFMYWLRLFTRLRMRSHLRHFRLFGKGLILPIANLNRYLSHRKPCQQ